MPHFVKSGFWEQIAKEYKGSLNLDRLISTLSPLVNLSPGAGISITGTYPNLTITNVGASIDLVYFNTVTDLKAINYFPANKVLYVKDQYQGGEFYYDSTDTTSSDDGGTILVGASGQRFKRIIRDGVYNIAWWAGAPYNFVGNPNDNTTAIQNAVYAAMRYSTATNQRPKLYFPAGFWYISNTINFTTNPDNSSTVDGWTIDGVQSETVITIPHGTTINGPMFNFNKNSSTLSRYNIIKNLYFYSDSFNGKALQVLDLSYNNRFGLYNVRTSRVSTQVDLVINFGYEGTIQQCSLSGGKPLSQPSDGVQMNNQANAILFSQTSIDNYIGNGSTITGSGIYFGQSKSVMIHECTIQQCDYGVTFATGAWAPVIQGGYFEGNAKADIRLGTAGGSLYSVKIDTPSLRSQNGVNVNGLLFDGANIFGMNCSTISFENDDAIGFNPLASQKLQDIIFNNCRTGGTVFSYRNLINTSQQVYMDNIQVIAPGTGLNGIDVKSFTPIVCEPYKEYCTDFNTWTNSDGSGITYLASNGTWLGATAWMKNDASTHTMMFTLADTSGLQNQVVTFSMWVKFNGSINVNDLFWLENQAGTRISTLRPLRPATLPTTQFVKMYCYGLVGASDTSLRVKILTRDNNIFYTNPSIKLGFV